MKIKVTEFAARHFDPKFGGTKILNTTIEDFEKEVNFFVNKGGMRISPNQVMPEFKDGYAPFCKLLPMLNFTDARVGSMPITLENYQYIRSGYSARRDSELPVFSRWLELPLGKPKAEWLMLVLYSKEQIEKEWRADLEKKFEDYQEKHHVTLTGDDKRTLETLDGFKYEFENVEFDYGIVAVLGQCHPNEEPMKPETMIRNALGVSEGGSGVPLDREKYLTSVEFWERNATVK